MLSHLSGALLALIGLIVLLRRGAACALSWRARATLGVYAGSLFFAFSASALFHYFPWDPEELVFFKKLDHAAIFVLIAGTCTVLLNAGGRRRRRLLIASCWVVATAAMALKMIFWPMALWMTAGVYLAVGWIAAASVLRAMRHVPWQDLRLLVYGMVIYSVAAVVFATESPVLWPGIIEGHEVFHFLALAGAATHFIFIHRHCTVPGGLRNTSLRTTSARVNLAADPRGS